VGDQVTIQELIGRIRRIRPRYAEPAYLLVLAALESVQKARPVRGHVRGDELSWACRDFARRQYGLLARTVLTHWGVETTADFGAIVYELIEANLLVPDSDDCIESFDSVFDFEGAFDRDYQWTGISDLVQAENALR
jgi:uncharacterized repeat protein (TIGR04138 family)